MTNQFLIKNSSHSLAQNSWRVHIFEYSFMSVTVNLYCPIFKLGFYYYHNSYFLFFPISKKYPVSKSEIF